MHICFLCSEYPPGKHGGVGSFTQTLGRNLVARGHRVTVLGIYQIKRVQYHEDEGVTVIRLPHTGLRGGGFLLNGSRLNRELQTLHRQHPIDVLEGPELALAHIPRNLTTCILRLNGGHHFFTTTLGNRPRAWPGWLEKRSFARADAFCAVSQFVAETTRRLLQLCDQPIEILPNPVNTERFRPQSAAREEEGLLVFVGTVCEKKGIRQLVQALPRIVAAVPKARLLVIGRDSRDPHTGGSFIAGLRSLVEPAVRAKIEFTEHVENQQLPDLLARASVCVYPSHMEAQGIVIIEGMAMGKAVVISQTGPGPELVEDRVSGLLCDPHDPASIADCVIALLKNAEFRQRLGQQARARVLQRFSTEVLVQRNEEFYRRCVQNQRES